MMARVQLIVAALILPAVATDLHDKSGASLRLKTHSVAAGSSKHKKIVKQPEVEQTLVICNAYASPSSLDIYHVQTLDRITASRPLNYKDCREFTMSLAEGDQLDFKSGNLDVGTFYATGLPKTSSSLLLIPHRRDSRSVAISFESHAFADLQSPQIAVVDAYKGKGEGAVKIMDALPEGSTVVPVEESLKFSSVVAVSPGNYKVMLKDASNATAYTSRSLLAENEAKYVVMRVGVESATGDQAYPQELIVFPSGSLGLGLGISWILLCALFLNFH